MLTTRQRAILQTLIDTLIPPDADFSGGWEAGAGDYLLRQLTGGDLVKLLPMYRAGLDALDAEARGVYAKAFDALTAAERERLLKTVEAGRVSVIWEIDPRAFVRIAAEHAAEGFYGDPGNGGNRNGVSWAMIGFVVKDTR